MSDTREYAQPMERCIDIMREQMARPENIAKAHWNESSSVQLLASLNYNVEKLVKAVSEHNQYEAFLRAANIANHAWMIADNVQLPENTEQMTPIKKGFD